MLISVNPNKPPQNQNFKLYVIRNVTISALQNKKNIKMWPFLKDILENVFEF